MSFICRSRLCTSILYCMHKFENEVEILEFLRHCMYVYIKITKPKLSRNFKLDEILVDVKSKRYQYQEKRKRSDSVL